MKKFTNVYMDKRNNTVAFTGLFKYESRFQRLLLEFFDLCQSLSVYIGWLENTQQDISKEQMAGQV